MIVFIAVCWPRRLSKSSFNRSWFQIVLAFPFQVNWLGCVEPLVIRCVSSWRHENNTAHPINAVSNAAARSGLAFNTFVRSCLRRTKVWIWVREALMSVVSEQMATIVIGASLYLLRSSFKIWAVETHVAVILSFIKSQLWIEPQSCKAEGHTTEAVMVNGSISR